MKCIGSGLTRVPIARTTSIPSRPNQADVLCEVLGTVKAG